MDSFLALDELDPPLDSLLPLLPLAPVLPALVLSDLPPSEPPVEPSELDDEPLPLAEPERASEPESLFAAALARLSLR